MYSFYDYMQMGGMPQMKAGGDPDGQMAMGQIMAMHEKLSALQKFIQPDSDLEPWVASKLTLADDYLNSVAEYMQYNPEENGEMQYEEEGLPEQQMMKGGGYVVTRSSDRKGKTHKVTGPDGTVKYFGDSKLGQHPKDPERKKAFYARHKKNLAGNPHFRAFARKTWEEGGEIEEMKSGGSTYANGVWYQEGGENDFSNRWNKYLPEMPQTTPIPYRSEEVYYEPVRQKQPTANKQASKKKTIASKTTEPEQEPLVRRDSKPTTLPTRTDDSTLENILEVFDPTGISSWDDVYRSYKETGISPETALEVFGALPLVGKAGKVTKAGLHLAKYKGLEKLLYKNLPKSNVLSNAFKGIGLIGRGSDAVQAAQQAPAAPLMPNFGMDNMPFAMGGIYAGSEDIDRYQLGRQRVSLAPSMSQDYYGDDTMMNPDDQYIQNMFSMEQPQKMPALNSSQGSMPPQVNYNGKQQAYLSDMYGSGMMTFDNKQQMNLTGQGVNNYAWDSYGQDQGAPAKTAAMTEAEKPFQIEQQEAINPIYGDVEKLQGMLNVASRKDLKASVKDFNNTYDSDMKVPGSYMGADGKKATRRINNFSDFLRKGISTASGVTDLFNMRKGKREQEWRDRNLGSTSSLYPVVPENMSGNRGDYVVTGSRYGDFRPDEKTVNLGQYTGKFYPQLNMQFGGGIIDEELSLPQELMQDPNVSMGIPEESAGAYENNTTPVNFNLTKDYKEYAGIANNFIKQVNPDTDITGEMLAYGAQMAEKKYGKTVPVELALAQLQQEGYLAKTKKPNRPQRTKNPFNVGNTDDRNNIPHNDLQSGIDSYYKLMATNYLSTRTPEQLLQNFVNKSGNRYASAENYESSLRNIITKINKTRQTKFEEGGFVEGDVYELSEEQIRSILSTGGNVEFL